MADSFELLTSDLADLLRAPPDGSSPHGASFTIDEVAFALTPSRGPAELLSVYCTFGALAPEARESDYLLLLESNLMLASSCSGAFGFIGATREVVYAFHLPMRDMSAPLLLDALRHTADQAHAWRKAQLAPVDGVLYASVETPLRQPERALP
ncbi:CesT family type III secretion system chaperone [Hydrogenophaga sp.]|uniref:CesT family type III secretion system chaperone n=1 Tax=Hydrogenophaga sp. TaxID=1904254 RepID=UPI0027173073|nr:CesT family type III secretion system chaperone [Hydrogenophaga sp.]MDO9437208.1 CesT family type III secretion system chaperone [Hydrogenophaga sp.]